MGFRFYRRVKIFPGLYLNFSKKGISASVGMKGARLTFSKDGTRATVGIPGSGISYSEYSPKKKKNSISQPASSVLNAEGNLSRDDKKNLIGCAIICVLILCSLIFLLSTCKPEEESWDETVNEYMSKAILTREFRKKGREYNFEITKVEHDIKNRTCYMEGTFSDGRKKGVFKALFYKPMTFDKHSHNWMVKEYFRTE